MTGFSFQHCEMAGTPEKPEQLPVNRQENENCKRRQQHLTAVLKTPRSRHLERIVVTWCVSDAHDVQRVRRLVKHTETLVAIGGRLLVNVDVQPFALRLSKFFLSHAGGVLRRGLPCLSHSTQSRMGLFPTTVSGFPSMKSQMSARSASPEPPRPCARLWKGHEPSGGMRTTTPLTSGPLHLLREYDKKKKTHRMTPDPSGYMSSFNLKARHLTSTCHGSICSVPIPNQGRWSFPSLLLSLNGAEKVNFENVTVHCAACSERWSESETCRTALHAGRIH